MALHPDLPISPYEILKPEHRWFPAAEELRATALDRLLPPFVANIRMEVANWRTRGYAGASPTSRALLDWWFQRDQLVDHADGTRKLFRYYFAQREAVETVIWLHDVRRVRDKFDLLRFDASGAVSAGMFDEGRNICSSVRPSTDATSVPNPSFNSSINASLDNSSPS